MLRDYGLHRLLISSTETQMVEDCYFMLVRFLKVKSDCNTKSICVEINLRKRNGLINASYNPNESFISGE